MDIYSKKFNVNYSDIQKNKKITNIAILKYMEEIACDNSELLGYGLNDLSKQGLGWAIINWKLKVYERPNYRDEITIKTWCRKIDKIYFYRDFEIYNDKNEIIGVGTSKWIWLNINKKTIEKFPKEVVESHIVIEKEVFPDYKFSKMKEPEDYINSFSYKTLRRDIDTNYHVNNLNYLRFAYEALPEEIYENIDFADVEIHYKKELKLYDEINCLYTLDEKQNHIIVIKNKKTNETNAIVKLKTI